MLHCNSFQDFAKIVECHKGSQQRIKMACLGQPMFWVNAINEKKQAFQKLVHEVQDNLASIPSVKALAVRTGVSESLCDMLFQEYLQTSSTRYIKEYRLEKAYQMLTQTNKPMAEISALCGVNNSYFSKMIREETGLTPMEYRRNYRRSNDSQK